MQKYTTSSMRKKNSTNVQKKSEVLESRLERILSSFQQAADECAALSESAKEAIDTKKQEIANAEAEIKSIENTMGRVSAVHENLLRIISPVSS